MMILLLSLLNGCTFSGKISPNIECTDQCDQDEQDCTTTCYQACADAGGTDSDTVCDQDCDTTCSDKYDECTLTCTSGG